MEMVKGAGSESDLRLAGLKTGQVALVQGIDGERRQRLKLLDNGLTPNTRIEVKKVAPMGDPIEISVRNYRLTLRKDEAALIQVVLEAQAHEGTSSSQSSSQVTPAARESADGTSAQAIPEEAGDE